MSVAASTGGGAFLIPPAPGRLFHHRTLVVMALSLAILGFGAAFCTGVVQL